MSRLLSEAFPGRPCTKQGHIGGPVSGAPVPGVVNVNQGIAPSLQRQGAEEHRKKAHKIAREALLD